MGSKWEVCIGNCKGTKLIVFLRSNKLFTNLGVKELETDQKEKLK